MPKPTFDKSTGWWAIQVRGTDGKRRKQPLRKDPNWRKDGKGRVPKKPPDDVLILARKYELGHIEARHGIELPSAVKPIPLRSYLETRVDSHAPTVAVGTTVVDRQAVRIFLEFTDREGVTDARLVTEDLVRKFQAERLKTVKASTVKMQCSKLSAMFRALADDGAIPKNPFVRTRLKTKSRTERPAFWEADELRRLREACPEWLADIVVVASNTGIRINALLNLRWTDVKWNAGDIHVRAETSKSGKAYSVPMNDAARDVLTKISLTTESEHVFVNGAGKPQRRGKVYEHLKAARVKAGLPAKKSLIHSLRHSFATHALNSGVPIHIVSQWLGHASITQTMVYIHASPEESRRRMDGFRLG